MCFWGMGGVRCGFSRCLWAWADPAPRGQGANGEVRRGMAPCTQAAGRMASRPGMVEGLCAPGWV